MTCKFCNRILSSDEIDDGVCLGCGYDTQEEDEFDPSELNDADMYFEQNRELDQQDEDLL